MSSFDEDVTIPSNVLALSASDTVAVTAHGSQRSGSFSNPRIKIITKAGEPLTFAEAKAYLNGGTAPEFPSSSLGDYAGLSDSDCQSILDKVPGQGPGLVDTGSVIKGRGIPILVLRSQNTSFAHLGVAAGQMKKNFILLACRTA